LRLRDELSRQRRALPRERVEKKYVFDGPGGKETIADLFGGRSQLIVYHFMFDPEWKKGCPSCSFLADTFDGAVVHLAQRDVSFVAISRAMLPQIEAFKKRMGWQFKWVSSFGNEFDYDYHVSFSKDEQAQGKVYYNYGMNESPSEEGPGASVFYKNQAGEISHTYSSFARTGSDDRYVPLVGSHAKRAGRRRIGLWHGVGAASRQVWRWTGGRPEEAVRSAGES
jgi:predicted dithiol-disulfide oxidoreductase (DUF899 family)